MAGYRGGRPPVRGLKITSYSRTEGMEAGVSQPPRASRLTARSARLLLTTDVVAI